MLEKANNSEKRYSVLPTFSRELPLFQRVLASIGFTSSEVLLVLIYLFSN